MKSHDHTTIHLPVKNLRSEEDATKIDRVLEGIKGRGAHHTDSKTSQVVLEGTEWPSLLSTVIRLLGVSGFEVPLEKKSLPVLKMSCAACAVNVQNTLQKQEGVVSASVNYANGEASLELLPSHVSLEQLKQAVQSTGYDLVIDESSGSRQSVEEMQQSELRILKRHTLVALSLAIPVMALAMIPFLMDNSYARYTMWALTTPVLFISGRRFFTGALKQLKHFTSNMDTLVAMSTGTAYLFSVYNTLFPEFWHSRGLHAHVYFEATAVVIAFILLGKWLEAKAKGHTSSAIKKLMSLQPKSVTISGSDGKTEERLIGELKTGDIIVVKPGEKIAVDGNVVDGNSFVDESMISGEPFPVEKNQRDLVFAGTINQKGSFRYKATRVGSETLLARIIKTVKEAQGSRAPIQQLADKISAVFVPAVLLIAVASFITWTIFGGTQGFTHGLMAFITVLVIACPCALGLATPTAIMAGIGRGATLGILIRDAESLETAKKINALMFDKTGTLTEGKSAVISMNWFVPEQDEWRDVLFSMEKQSEHPLAEAVTNHLNGKAAWLPRVQVEAISGQGLKGVYEGKTFIVGHEKLLIEKKISINENVSAWIQLQTAQARTVSLFASETIILAGMAIADSIKPSAAPAVKKLLDAGIEVYMLTGDNEASARSIAAAAGIEHYRSQVLPEDKAAFVKELQEKGKTVAMVGDGINDSNALALADVSMAMGKGSDIAMEVARMTILSGDLIKIPAALSLSKKTVLVIRQNLFWAFVYNIIGIPIAAGILFPVNGFLLNPMIAGAAMALSSLSVVSNSLRLKWTGSRTTV